MARPKAKLLSKYLSRVLPVLGARAKMDKELEIPGPSSFLTVAGFLRQQI